MHEYDMVCVECGKIMRCKKSGIVVKINQYIGNFKADLYECEDCGHEILTRFSKENIGNETDDTDHNIYLT